MTKGYTRAVNSLAPGDKARRPRLLVLTVHPPTVAATRLRVLQYVPSLNKADFDVQLWTLFSDVDLRRWYGPSQVQRAMVLLWALRRLPRALAEIRRADLVLVHREALPFGPPILELIAARAAPMIWDVDDAIWVDFASPTAGRVPRWVRGTFGKYERICRHAAEVWAGSEVLAEWARPRNASVTVVPTVIDVPPLRPARPGPVMAWIGTHSTGGFLDQILPALAESFGDQAQLLVVGASPRSGGSLDVREHQWSEATEQAVLACARVGLYPVDTTHPLAEGKCGLKAILYMAHGVPPVLTPTRPNRAIVDDGVEGLYATHPAEFAEAVATLFDDDDLWGRLRAAGHARVLRDFSLQVWAPRIVGRLRQLADTRN